MATRAQLEAEPWWGREVVPPALSACGSTIRARLGLSAGSVGIKGDYAHLKGGHRSQEWIKNSRYCTNRVYTTVAGLSAEQVRYLSAIDVTPGSPQAMIAQCRRVIAAMKAGVLDFVTEFYGNVDGDRVVDGWDNVADRAVSSDSSHLWHSHGTFDRRLVDNSGLLQRYADVLTGEGITVAISSDDVRSIAEGVKNIRTGFSASDPDGSTFAELLLGASGQAAANGRKLDQVAASVQKLASEGVPVTVTFDEATRRALANDIVEALALRTSLRFVVLPDGG